jgi:hypothetical protein
MKRFNLDPALLPRVTPAHAWRLARAPLLFSQQLPRCGDFLVHLVDAAKVVHLPVRPHKG